MGNTYSNLNYHIVFSTKYRDSLIHQSIEDELYLYIGGIIRDEEGILLEIGGTENHIHLVIKLKPAHFIPDILRLIKGSSSRWINNHKKTEMYFSWQTGYGAFSVSKAELPQIQAYVCRQKEHHGHYSYKDEFIQLLDRYEIEYNPEHTWD